MANLKLNITDKQEKKDIPEEDINKKELPEEDIDSRLWVDKYRPKSLEEIIFKKIQENPQVSRLLYLNQKAFCQNLLNHKILYTLIKICIHVIIV